MAIHDILNAGIGLYKEGEKSLRQALVSLQTSYEALLQQGEADQSATAEKLRQSLDETIANVRQISTKAETRLQELVKEAGRNYEQILAGLENQVESIRKQGELEIGGVKERMQGLADSLKDQAPERFRKSVERLLIPTESEDRVADAAHPGEERVSILFSESAEKSGEEKQSH